MENFIVLWEVKYYNHDPEKIFYVDEINSSKNLESLMDHLGENSVDHTPEDETPIGLGDFNIEWIMIKDMAGKELWRDEDYDFDDYNKQQ